MCKTHDQKLSHHHSMPKQHENKVVATIYFCICAMAKGIVNAAHGSRPAAGSLAADSPVWISFAMV